MDEHPEWRSGKMNRRLEEMIGNMGVNGEEMCHMLKS
jgi:hypothetical protein